MGYAGFGCQPCTPHRSVHYLEHWISDLLAANRVTFEVPFNNEFVDRNYTCAYGALPSFYLSFLKSSNTPLGTGLIGSLITSMIS